MDVLLKGRGAGIGARAPSWLPRLCGAAFGYMLLAVADRLGLSEITGIPPLISRVFAMAGGALIATTSWGSMLWIFSSLLVTVSMLVAFTPIVNAPLSHFIRRDSNVEPVDAVVVLSGSMTDDGRLGGPVLDRLLTGLAEARKRGAPTVALSVLESSAGVQRVTSEPDQRRLMALLAPELSVKFVYNVSSTRDEALQFTALANTNHWRRVAVVTSPLHSRRACRTIEVAGVPVTCVPADSREYSTENIRGSGARMNAFRDVVYETLATALYSARGWI